MDIPNSRFLRFDPLPFQKILYPTLGPPHPTNSGILDPIAAIVIGPSTLGGIPELAP